MTNKNELPLESVKVLEFTHAVMGPSCGVILADMGADIIRVEPVTGILDYRSATTGRLG